MCVICGERIKARGLCSHHYEMWRHGRLTVEARTRAEQESPICRCQSPDPDPIGQCRRCGRLVVTFAHANRDRFRAQWPDEWARAEAMGRMP